MPFAVKSSISNHQPLYIFIICSKRKSFRRYLDLFGTLLKSQSSYIVLRSHFLLYTNIHVTPTFGKLTESILRYMRTLVSLVSEIE